MFDERAIFPSARIDRRAAPEYRSFADVRDSATAPEIRPTVFDPAQACAIY
jgi:hypothetical protein